jgi:hypothetical protein
MTTEELERQMDKLPADLHRDLGGAVPLDRIRVVSNAHYAGLRRDAAINDFIPLLVYRFAREELVTAALHDLHEAA